MIQANFFNINDLVNMNNSISKSPASSPTLVSLFSGAGGMDLGFENAGFKTVWANEYDSTIAPSFQNFFKTTLMDTRSISKIPNEDIPTALGVIGGPPCQSWSEAGVED